VEGFPWCRRSPIKKFNRPSTQLPLTLIPPMGFRSPCPLVPREPLLDHGANVNTKASSSSYTMTALGIVASEGHTAVVQLLLGREADANAKDNYGRTPPWEAARNQHDSSEAAARPWGRCQQKIYFTIRGRHWTWQLRKGIRRWCSCFLNMGPRSHRQSVLYVHLYLHDKLHFLPATLHNSSPFHSAPPLLRYYHNLLWHHHFLHRLYQNLAPDDCITRPPRYLHVGDLLWFELFHQRLVHSQRTATSIRLFSSRAKYLYRPPTLL
jgi:Ankyrin repeats (many copies)